MSKPIEIYVDADACPVKNEIYRVAERHGLKVLVVSNAPIMVPREPWIERVVVGAGDGRGRRLDRRARAGRATSSSPPTCRWPAAG